VYGIHPNGVEVTVTTVFDASAPLDRAVVGQMVDGFPHLFPHLKLKPEDISFNAPASGPFHLKLRLFSGKGSVEVTPLRVAMVFHEVVLVRDVEPISNVLLGISLLLKDKAPLAATTAEINFHGELTSGGKRKAYFASLVAPVAAAPYPEGMVYHRYDRAFPSDVRVSIERSDHLPEGEGLYYTWTARFRGVLTGEIAGAIKTSVTDSMVAMHLQFEEGSIVL
jgi:hypothetical protein